MSRSGRKPWRAWIAAVAGVLLVLKTAAYVIPRLFALVTDEAKNRGADVNLAVNLANRGRHLR
jgi:hypothetical protein